MDHRRCMQLSIQRVGALSTIVLTQPLDIRIAVAAFVAAAFSYTNMGSSSMRSKTV